MTVVLVPTLPVVKGAAAVADASESTVQPVGVVVPVVPIESKFCEYEKLALNETCACVVVYAPSVKIITLNSIVRSRHHLKTLRPSTWFTNVFLLFMKLLML